MSTPEDGSARAEETTGPAAAVAGQVEIGTGDDDGRSGDGDDDRFFVRVSADRPPSLQECYDFVTGPLPGRCGAVSTFVGVTRDNFNGRKVKKLSYEGYVPMAVKELRRVCADAVRKYGSVYRIAAAHVLGDCPAGHASVVLAASSPHRIDAIRCTEFLIDELKARVPIWKLEVYDDDNDGQDSVWKENVEWRAGKRRRVMVRQRQEEREGGSAAVAAAGGDEITAPKNEPPEEEETARTK